MNSYCRIAPLLLTLGALMAGCSQPAPVPAATPEVMPKPAAAPEAPRKDGPFTVTVEFGETYTPNEDNSIALTMAYEGTEPVTALALQLKLPLGWQFSALTDGPKPAIVPKAGATDMVTLVWIQSPEFPATLTCSIIVPDWAEGSLALEARTIYRTLGGELQSPWCKVTAKSPV